jgi:hypothetical protein
MMSRLDLGPIKSPIQWEPEGVSPGVKLLGYEANNSHPPSAKVKNGGTIPQLPHTYSWHGA